MLEAVSNRSISNNSSQLPASNCRRHWGEALSASLKTRAPMVAAALTGQQALGT